MACDLSAERPEETTMQKILGKRFIEKGNSKFKDPEKNEYSRISEETRMLRT